MFRAVKLVHISDTVITTADTDLELNGKTNKYDKKDVFDFSESVYSKPFKQWGLKLCHHCRALYPLPNGIQSLQSKSISYASPSWLP